MKQRVKRTFAFVPAMAMLAGIAFVGTSAPTRASGVQVGQPAPDFVATDSQGKSVALSSLRGKTVVLEWTNHECPYTRKHYDSGNMQGLQKAATADGVVWLSIVSSAPGREGYVDGKAADKLTVSRKAAPSAVLLDPKGTIGRLYKARTTPHMFVIDKGGRVAYMGAIDSKPSANPADIASSKNYVRGALASLKSGKAIAPSRTSPYGCSVKY